MRHDTRELHAEYARNFRETTAVRMNSSAMVAGVELDQDVEVRAMSCDRARSVEIVGNQRNIDTTIDEPRCPIQFLRRLRGSDQYVAESVSGEIFRLCKSRHRDSARLSIRREPRDHGRLRSLEMRTKMNAKRMRPRTHAREVALEDPLVE